MESVHFGVCTVSIVSTHEAIMHLAGVCILFYFLIHFDKSEVLFYLLIE